MTEKLDIVLLSTADWDNPFWTNKQHVAVQLAALGNKVLYIESFGLRRPSATGRDIKRILRRLRKGMSFPREVRPNLWIWSPLVIPLQSIKAIRVINSLITRVSLYWLKRHLRLLKPILWTYSPLTSEFLDTSKFRLIIYHAVDDIKAQPGMPSFAIEKAELSLATKCDIIFVTSKTIEASLSRVNPSVYYFSNVADYDHFSSAKSDLLEVPIDLQAIQRPRIGLVGAISAYKVDFNLLERIAVAHPEWSIVLIGSVGEGDPWTSAATIRKFKNIHFLGPRPYATLPAYLKGIDVAIIAAPSNDYTASMFPMKFFEYLAAGKSVVASRLPSLIEYSGVAEMCNNDDAFVASIERSLVDPRVTDARRDTVARAHTYENRMSKMLVIVFRHLEGRIDKT